ncbi:pleckstrin homology domain-containing family A member 8-like [Mizuhopecten yessoensis]|uniref:Pleckstrin homology domain-containing family A member 8 n=1 Tax=Mizuhopecten yessoensis TaxID=6573 RepID=A0A210Q1D1_MIZYE|nr:pleckstrin homology domain-containing family A member 8-like [Mizuhopecten yessoensis]OWF42560.1 Pleckstrin homology domain-containing family A member 8 [Mizuhopecten yessoensis]
MATMEGLLWKWTNYMSGWQPRWFVLDNGVLSYYKSQEDVINGCKGSLQMSVCDISVHSTDHTRLDLIIPHEQHFYIKASSPHERQRWLVAMGTCKASLTNGRPSEEMGEISPDIVRTKKSELRLYCDLLMQQVHSVKSAIQESQPEVKKLDEATSLLGATCDTFIQTLDDCMKIANASIAYETSPKPVRDVQLVLPQKTVKKGERLSTSGRPSSAESRSVRTSPLPRDGLPSFPKSSNRRRTASENSHSDQSLSDHSMDANRDHTESDNRNSSTRLSVTMETNSFSKSLTSGSVSKTNVNSGLDHSSKRTENGVTSLEKSSGKSLSSTSINSEEEFKDAIDAKVPTFFSTMEPSFMDIKLEEDGGIPVQPFLGSCRSLVPIFDKFNATTFAPVKMDFQGNIRKIQQKYSTKPSDFTTLQRMVLFEMRSQQHHLSSSATVALLWMKRGLEFIRAIFQEMLEGQPDLCLAVNNAYSRTLKPFHGWVVRGVFAVAVKALPYKEVFITQLRATGHPGEGSIFLQSLMADLDSYCTALDEVIRILKDFYKSHSLDNDEQI